jgi:prophage tail gpP-like protein
MPVTIQVNGKTFDLFKQVDISRSLDDFSGEARILTTEPESGVSPIKINDLVTIYLDNVPVLSGYIETASDSESNSSHDISYRVRDKVSDIIDSTVPDNVKTLTGITRFSAICDLVVNGLGLSGDIKVIDNINATFSSDDQKGAKVGQNCGEFLQGYARRVQVFMNTDGEGNILLERPCRQLQTRLVNETNGSNNNIIDSSLEYNYSKRYGKYIVRSNGSSDDEDASNADVKGEATDSEIRTSRIFEKISDSPMSAEECRKAAIEEANIRRTRSFKYTCKVQGFSANGELWDAGRLVSVNDTRKNVIGQFVIKSVTYNYSSSGEFCSMELTFPDAYAVQANMTAVQKRTSTASTYTVVSGDELNIIAAREGLNLDDLIAANPQIENPDLIFPGDTVNIPVRRV